MKFFLDTAITSEIKKAADYGIVDGVTTNPTLIAKSGRDMKEVILEITSIIDGPVSAEVISTDYDGMMEEARKWAAVHPNIVVKIPFIPEGVKAVSSLTKEGIKTNVTLIFSATQALIACKAGATMISPFVGRLDDISHDGMDLVEDCLQIIDNYGFDSEVIVASVRHPIHVLQAAQMGAHIVTLPLKVLEQMFKHPLTSSGLAQFLKDWEKSQES